MKRNKSGMTLVEVVVSMAILALTVAVSFAAISFSINVLNRAETINSEYMNALEDMVDELDSTQVNDKSISVSIEEENKGNITFNKIETKTDSEENILGSFYYYALKY